MKVTKDDLLYLKVSEKNPDWCFGKIFYVACLHEDPDTWSTAPKHVRRRCSVRAQLSRNRLIKEGVMTTQGVPLERTLLNVKRRHQEIEGIVHGTLKADDTFNKLNKADLPADYNTESNIVSDIKHGESMKIYNALVDETLERVNKSRESLESFVCTIAMYASMIIEYRDKNGFLKRTMRNPNAAIQSAKLLAEMGGFTTPVANNVNIRIDNVLEEIARRRTKEIMQD